MTYTKIDETSFKETTQVERTWKVEDIKREIEMYDNEIAHITERKAELQAKLTEAGKIGVKIKVE